MGLYTIDIIPFCAIIIIFILDIPLKETVFIVEPLHVPAYDSIALKQQMSRSKPKLQAFPLSTQKIKNIRMVRIIILSAYMCCRTVSGHISVLKVSQAK